jgi:hypothetical protein
MKFESRTFNFILNAIINNYQELIKKSDLHPIRVYHFERLHLKNQ